MATVQQKEKPVKEYQIKINVETTELDKLIEKFNKAKSLANEVVSLPVKLEMEKLVESSHNAISNTQY